MPDAPAPSLRPIDLVRIPPPPPEQRAARAARFAAEGEKRGRYHLPDALESGSPVGYRTRPSLTEAETRAALSLLSLPRPAAFRAGSPPTEQELFEEASLGLLSSRQSTNYRGLRQVTLGPADSAELAQLLRGLRHLDAPPLAGATHSHIVLTRPYRTPFTFLLTFIGHAPIASLFTVGQRAWRKRFQHQDDIPTIGYLQHLHVGILAEAMERAAILASDGRRRAQILMRPFSGASAQEDNAELIQRIEALAGLGPGERAQGWRIALVAQVGEVEPLGLDRPTCRRLGAALLSLRSERIQPGVNQEEKAPPPYQARQDMDVPDALTEMAGRAAFNAFSYWTGQSHDEARELLIIDRVDVLHEGGKERLRSIRRELEAVTDRVVSNLPLWADLPTGRALSRNAQRGRKAFALAGQRIYIGGLSRPECEARGLDWTLAVRAFGAAAARSALVAELAGITEIPEGCDMLAGICLMAGPVNQNDIGKEFYGMQDLLAVRFPHRQPTSLLVWTLKAKTVADPIGNEEQLLNPARKGALVDLRASPHEVVALRIDGRLQPMRKEGERVNAERAFHDVGNFVVDPEGREIPGNRGEPWPQGASARPWG